MFDQTITLYHYTRDANGEHWVRTVLTDVYFVGQIGVKTIKEGRTPDNGAMLYIPLRNPMPVLIPGDKLLEGEQTAEVIKSPSELRTLGEVHTVTAIKRFSFGGDMAHWKVWCDGSQV